VPTPEHSWHLSEAHEEEVDEEIAAQVAGVHRHAVIRHTDDRPEAAQ